MNRGYVDGQLRADGTLATYTGTNSPTVYRGDRLPAELQGNVFIAEPTGNLVSRIIVTDNGTTLARDEGLRQYRVPHLDRRALPARLPVERARRHALHRRHVPRHHPGEAYITEYLRDQILKRKLEQPIHMGRIYRVVHDTTPRDSTRVDLATESSAQLVARLSHPNGWWRDTAQRLLVERGDKSVVRALRKLADSSPDARSDCTRCGRSTGSTA